VVLRRSRLQTRLHRAPPPYAPVARASDALLHQATCLVTVLLVRPFVATTTTASADFLLRLIHRRPFRHKARSPQVRARSFPAQSPHLRRLDLTTTASQFIACSPCQTPPQMRFVYLDSRICSVLPPHAWSPSRSCTSLRSLWSAHGRTCTSKIAPMLGAQRNGAP
jgi:hypothetical protein